MATIAEVRANYPQYADMTDLQLGQALYKKYYSDIPWETFSAKAGLSLVNQIPGSESAPPPTPEPSGTMLEKLGAGLRTAARTALSIPAAPIAGWSALATHGKKGPQFAGEQFQRNMAAMIPPPTNSLDVQYSQNVGNVMNELAPAMGLPGAATMLARTAGPAIGQTMRVAGREASYVADELKSGLNKIPIGGPMFNPTSETAALGQKFEAIGGKVPLHTLSSNRVTRIAGDWIDNLPLSGSPKVANKIAINKELLRQIGGDEKAGLLTPSSFAPAMEKSGSSIGRMYSKTSVPLDDLFDSALQDIVKQQTKQTPDTSKIVSSYIDDLRTAADENGGSIPGDTLRAHDSALGKRIRSLPPGDLRGELSDLQETMRDALSRQLTPAENASLNTYRKQYAIGKLLEPLVAKNQGNGVMPSELMGRQLSTSAGKHRMATGAAGDMGDLAAIGQQFLKQSNSSGLGERGLILGALINTAKIAPAIAIGQAYNRIGPMISSKILGNGSSSIPKVPWTLPTGSRPFPQLYDWTDLPPQPVATEDAPAASGFPALSSGTPGSFPPLEPPSVIAANVAARKRANDMQVGLAQEQSQAAQEAANRAPTGRGTPLILDPITGRLQSVSRGMKGATPDVVLNYGNELASAVDKMSSGRAFAMSAEERIAWNKSKTDLASAVPGFNALSDSAITGKMMDRQWVTDAISKAREKAQGFAEIAKRSENAQKIRAAVANRERMTELADSLQESLSSGRPVTPKNKALGQVARGSLSQPVQRGALSE